MQNQFFNNRTNAERLSKKLINWYGVNPTVKHNEDYSEILVNGLKFTVSNSKQFDKHNAQFSLRHDSRLIDCTKMYSLVNNSKNQ
jgi:hypothetical protein